MRPVTLFYPSHVQIFICCDCENPIIKKRTHYNHKTSQKFVLVQTNMSHSCLHRNISPIFGGTTLTHALTHSTRQYSRRACSVKPCSHQASAAASALTLKKGFTVFQWVHFRQADADVDAGK